MYVSPPWGGNFPPTVALKANPCLNKLSREKIEREPELEVEEVEMDVGSELRLEL